MRDLVYDFFFFKQKTAYEMRISDWSSDVCSSDLINIEGEIHGGDATQTSNTSHRVQLKVYDVTGGLVLERLPERVTGNRFHITWNGRNAGGQSCRPGVYFIHVVIDGRPASGKVINVDTPESIAR